MEKERPKIGVGIIVKKGNKILMIKRKNSHGSKTWSCPGGHLEFLEKIEDCAKRDVYEETGVRIKNIALGPYTQDFFKKENKHYLTIWAISDWKSGMEKIKEPEKTEKVQWFYWNKLPKPLFLPLKNLLKQKFNPFGKWKYV